MRIKDIKKLDKLSAGHHKREDPCYYIDNGHINYSNSNKCLLCGTEIYSNRNKICSDKLDNVALQVLMDSKKEWFILLLDQHADLSIESTDYTGFMPHPDSPDDLTILIYNKDMNTIDKDKWITG